MNEKSPAPSGDAVNGNTPKVSLSLSQYEAALLTVLLTEALPKTDSLMDSWTIDRMLEGLSQHHWAESSSWERGSPVTMQSPRRARQSTSSVFNDAGYAGYNDHPRVTLSLPRYDAVLLQSILTEALATSQTPTARQAIDRMLKGLTQPDPAAKPAHSPRQPDSPKP